MALLNNFNFSTTLTSPANSTFKPHKPVNVSLFSISSKPSSSLIAIHGFPFNRLRISPVKTVLTRLVLTVSALVNDDSETYPEVESNGLSQDASIGLKLPRRSLLVQFTCNECGERTQRMINRFAYERGLVFVQCAGCERYHKLADNLGLIVEYDLREEPGAKPDGDHA